MNSADVEALLEEGERQAKAKDAANNKGARRPHRDHDVEPELDTSIDPRRHGRKARDDGHHSSGGNRYSAEREENDERRSRKSRGLGEDEEMKDASDKGSANGSVRSRRRSRSPDANRRRDRHYRDRSDPLAPPYRDDDRFSHGDTYYGSGRVESYRPGRDGGNGRPRTRDGHHERSRSPRPDPYERRNPDHRRPEPGSRRGKPKSPEPTDDERDRRTVFVQQLAARLRTKELKAFFEQVGGVVDAQIVKDRVSGRSKG